MNTPSTLQADTIVPESLIMFIATLLDNAKHVNDDGYPYHTTFQDDDIDFNIDDYLPTQNDIR